MNKYCQLLTGFPVIYSKYGWLYFAWSAPAVSPNFILAYFDLFLNKSVEEKYKQQDVKTDK